MKKLYNIIPTNSLFGIIFPKEETSEILKIKGYENTRPFSIIFNSLKRIQKEGYQIPPKRYAKKAYTFLCTRGNENIYARIAHSRIQKKFTEEKPMYLTSANLKGRKSNFLGIKELVEANKKLRFFKSRCCNPPSKIYLNNCNNFKIRKK